jgi:Flp pilus assembly CpaF family ATPase
MNKRIADQLSSDSEDRSNVLRSGGTGTDKNVFLNALGRLVSHKNRMFLIEYNSEILFETANLIRFGDRQEQSGLTLVKTCKLLETSARHCPDQIVPSEVRGGDAFDLLQLLSTSRSGTLSTVRASSTQQVIGRFNRRVLQSGVELLSRAAKSTITESFNIIIQFEGQSGIQSVSGVLEFSDYSSGTDHYDWNRVCAAGVKQ